MIRSLIILSVGFFIFQTPVFAKNNISLPSGTYACAQYSRSFQIYQDSTSATWTDLSVSQDSYVDYQNRFGLFFKKVDQKYRYSFIESNQLRHLNFDINQDFETLLKPIIGWMDSPIGIESKASKVTCWKTYLVNKNDLFIQKLLNSKGFKKLLKEAQSTPDFRRHIGAAGIELIALENDHKNHLKKITFHLHWDAGYETCGVNFSVSSDFSKLLSVQRKSDEKLLLYCED